MASPELGRWMKKLVVFATIKLRERITWKGSHCKLDMMNGTNMPHHVNEFHFSPSKTKNLLGHTMYSHFRLEKYLQTKYNLLALPFWLNRSRSRIPDGFLFFVLRYLQALGVPVVKLRARVWRHARSGTSPANSTALSPLRSASRWRRRGRRSRSFSGG